MGANTPDLVYSHKIQNDDINAPIIYRCARVHPKIPYVESYSPKVHTLLDMFNFSVNHYGYRNCIGHRPVQKDGSLEKKFVWKTYKQIELETTLLAKSIKKLDLINSCEDEKGKINVVGIYSRNREEWICTEIALWKNRSASVAFYDSLSKESLIYIINQVKMKSIFLEKKCFDQIVSIKNSIPSLQNIIFFDLSSE